MAAKVSGLARAAKPKAPAAPESAVESFVEGKPAEPAPAKASKTKDKPKPAHKDGVRIAIELPPDLARKFKALCALEGQNVREVAEELFAKWVEEKRKSQSL